MPDTTASSPNKVINTTPIRTCTHAVPLKGGVVGCPGCNEAFDTALVVFPRLANAQGPVQVTLKVWPSSAFAGPLGGCKVVSAILEVSAPALLVQGTIQVSLTVSSPDAVTAFRLHGWQGGAWQTGAFKSAAISGDVYSACYDNGGSPPTLRYNYFCVTKP